VAGGLWQGPGVNREVCIATIETVTVLFTDLVGSTQLESGVGPVRADELRAEHFAIRPKTVAAGAGRVAAGSGFVTAKRILRRGSVRGGLFAR
jgi:class 3 adenylate cyclase